MDLIDRKQRIVSDLERLIEPKHANQMKYDIRQEKANDLNVIYTEIQGPKDSLYEGGYFVIRFEFTKEYPVSSPSVAFATKIWHPNVDHNSGSVCLNSLNQNWQPTVTIRQILDTHMPWLLENGNADDPLNTDAGTQMKDCDPKYAETVKLWVNKYANGSTLKKVGNVWYQQRKRKKKKKKKKFSFNELNELNNNNNKKNKNETKAIDHGINGNNANHGNHGNNHSNSNNNNNNHNPKKKVMFNLNNNHKNKNENENENKNNISFDNWWMKSKCEQECELSSMDDEPTLDLESYCSLTTPSFSKSISFHSMNSYTKSPDFSPLIASVPNKYSFSYGSLNDYQLQRKQIDFGDDQHNDDNDNDNDNEDDDDDDVEDVVDDVVDDNDNANDDDDGDDEDGDTMVSDNCHLSDYGINEKLRKQIVTNTDNNNQAMQLD